MNFMAKEEPNYERANLGLEFWAAHVGLALKTYADMLTPGQKTGILGAMLKNFCELTPQELEVFLLPEETPITMETATNSLRLACATTKVGDFYSGITPFPKGEEYEKKKKAFDEDVRLALKDKEDKTLLNEILYLMDDPINFGDMLVDLVSKLPIYRRVRRAYVVRSVDVVTQIIDPETGSVIDAFDSTPSFDDPNRDPLDVIDELYFGRRDNPDNE